ncbi:alpha-D-ribose 1-methylphosphonate 5-triphosphate diphosphatase [Labrys wisconsinensis]|uniref:Alpha-D-ribose 1-methylphosphonate 5-triphosphate diphosphatase n=1 Tax=Labrys wisconsinensis TaxID=425677 RepID=A0ABU0JEF1_9HYPH|nr:alpha-D-ribose 1-methylphosphonate 5-triphosphate diphosphatase [Labrys wisconsinensis]MDQ0472657.1 alpha-D-ribose 1-methylphosphonate 5-triphosphate diphosphatase [Labrys wisconsinensis]
MTLLLANARIVRTDAVVEDSLAIRDGLFAEAVAGADRDTIDCEGDFLIPGLVDLHTDNVEHHAHPRPAVRWPSMLSAVLAHDWQVLGAGVTTVLDALSLGDYDSAGARTAMLDGVIGALTQARSAGLLRADHYLHFRCELSDPGLMPILDRHVDNDQVRLVSLMDHTPGQRQWHDLALFREFRRKKSARVWSDEEFGLYLAERQANQRQLVPPSRARLGEIYNGRNIPIASHDDTTVADVEESHANGVGISEFPTTAAAARRARELGMTIVMGAPNVVLGGSHSGNVSAIELAERGLLDVLTSDYVPGSLLDAAFKLTALGLDLPQTIAMVSANPADVLGFGDRGRIAPGLRADLLRVRLVGGVPTIRAIWIAGRRLL